MSWLSDIQQIEEFEDCEFDASLVHAFEHCSQNALTRPIRFSTPTFKEFESDELKGCSKNSFPPFQSLAVRAHSCVITVRPTS